MRTLLACPLALVAAPAVASTASAEEPRSVDFGSGLIVHQPVHPDDDAIPAVGMELRAYDHLGLFASLRASWEASADLTNPEHGQLTNSVAAGGALGGWRDLSPRLTVYGGVRAEWLRVGSDDGLRFGPLASVGLVVGHAWGHPMALELELSYFDVRAIDDGAQHTWQGGLFLTGVLFPDRPLR